MRVWFNMDQQYFLDQLRYIAINAKARPQIITAIDDIILAPSEDEINSRIGEAVEEAEKRCFAEGKEDMWQDIYNLVTDMDGDETTLGKLLSMLENAKP